MQKGLIGQEIVEREFVKSVYKDQHDIIRVIMKLYCPNGIELDATYSIGQFYVGVPQPKFKYDIEPQTEKVIKADCQQLPNPNDSINSIMFDPPFVAGIGKDGKPGIIRTRFGSYKTVEDLWQMYHGALKEFYRILKVEGVLVVKCQDTISSGKQYLSHVEIINYAINIGFYPIDMFILLADNRILDGHGEQQHARKYHSYFLVFKKKRCRVKYTSSLRM